MRPEWIVTIEGTVVERPENMVNEELQTGRVELKAENITVLSEAETPPIDVQSNGHEIGEEKRLRYRYIDLRRPRLQRNMRIRQQVLYSMRKFLVERDFLEIETPLLGKSTPEGARDFLVPSRNHPGTFYALPQSPQQYKQMLQIAGFERYFQIARCLRDEDPRGDRQAEHTQLDIEMAFAEQEDILSLVEELYIYLVTELFPDKHITTTPFPRLTYEEVMQQYGTDAPDLRVNPDDGNELAFAFIVDWPLFEQEAETQQWSPAHHPFTKPKTNDPEEVKKTPGSITSWQHDFVLNGFEIGGGSCRITDLDMLKAVFAVLGHEEEQVKHNFSNYFEAFQYGVPPHGGIAPGVDRFLAIVLGEENIREVIAFPKTGDNRDLMMEAPAPVTPEQLEELHIQIIRNEEDDE